MELMKERNVNDFSEADFQALSDSLGAPEYRGWQIALWVFHRDAISFDEMSDLPKGLRKTLNENFAISRLNLLSAQASKDGTQNFFSNFGEKRG